VKGKLYHDARTVFGAALVCAYKLESEIVKYPRIMISSEVVSDTSKIPDMLPSGPYSGLISEADDGPRFFNLLKTMVPLVTLTGDDRSSRIKLYNQIADQIQKRYNESFDTPRHFEKVQWFARYWNENAMAFGVGVKLITKMGFDGHTRVTV
jgi:hypothetical protein